MRFESLLWMALAMFLAGGGWWSEERSLAGDVSGDGEYQAADGGSDFPPPPPSGP